MSSAEFHKPHRRLGYLNVVGRHPSEAPEVYGVTDAEVERLPPDRANRPPTLDGHGRAAAHRGAQDRQYVGIVAGEIRRLARHRALSSRKAWPHREGG